MHPIYRIAKVVVIKQIGEPLDYSIPDPLLQHIRPGMRVLIPVRKKRMVGLVIRLDRDSKVSGIKAIIELLDQDPILDKTILQLTQQVAEHHLSDWGTSIRAAIPPGLITSSTPRFRITDKGKQIDLIVFMKRSLLESAPMHPIYRIAKVVVIKQIGEPLDYSIPDPLLQHIRPGMRVLIPVRKKRMVGLVIRLDRDSKVSGIKAIIELLDQDPILDKTILQLTQQVAEHHLSDWGTSIRAAIPPGLITSSTPRFRITDKGKQVILTGSRLSKKQRKILEVLTQSPSRIDRVMTFKSLCQWAGFKISKPSLALMITNLWIEQIYPDEAPLVFKKWAIQNPAPISVRDKDDLFTLLDRDLPSPFKQSLSDHQFKVFFQQDNAGLFCQKLIVNASKELQKKQTKSILVLAPEVNQVQSIAGHLADLLQIPIIMLHSELSEKIRQATWLKLSGGDFSILVGTRSAVFAPIRNLGLIVVIQESNPSYKEEGSPHYHAREVAFRRASMSHCPVLLTGYTPSIETYIKLKNQEYEFLSPSHSPGRSIVSIVDMKSPYPSELLSDQLIQSIQDRLKVKHPVLLLLNRRGYSTALLCRDCAYVLRCSRCAVALVHHRKVLRLICHYCGTKKEAPSHCPSCKGRRLGGVGIGIEQAEHSLQKLFPQARILRIDRDHQGSKSRIADIYLGTDQILRWTDRPQTDLIGVLDADTALHLPDFHAPEQTFQSLYRLLSEETALNKKRPHEIIIQTRFPEIPCIAWAKNKDPDHFYSRELLERKSLGYPPYMNLGTITIRSTDQTRGQKAADQLAKQLRYTLSEEKDSQILGPAPAPITPLRGFHRTLLLIKTRRQVPLHQLIGDPISVFKKTLASNVQIVIDVDPIRIR